MPEQNDLGTVISTLDGPSPGNVDFVVNLPEMVLHRGQFVEMSYSEGTLIAMIVDLIKTNRYFERADSVKEFEASGKKMLEVFPTGEWEYLIAKTKPLGVFSPDGRVKRATSPISPGTKVRLAGNEKLHKFLGLDSANGLHIGNVEFHDLPVSLNLTRLFQKHLSILAQSGSGKSYLVSVMIEELLKRKKESGRLAAIVFDVHGEYINFGEAITDSKHEDYSNKTKVVKARDIRIGVPKLSAAILNSIIPDLSSAQVRDVARIIEQLRRNMQATGPFDFRDVKNAISADSEIKDSTKAALIGWLSGLEYLNLFARTDAPSITDLIAPGELTVIDFSDIVNQRKKQIIVSYFLRRLFDSRRSKHIPPFVAVIEEAHQFAPAMAKEESAISKGIIETIAREGRKFGASVCLISQRPKRLSTTALSQCNTHIILRITNPYDLKHIGESSEGLDQRSQDMISSQRVGEALIVGEATNYPVFVKIRERKSLESSHEVPLEKAALDFEARKEKAGEETEEFL